MGTAGWPATPDVSVVVIVYNDQEHLPRAVGSVLAQTLRGVDVVIVDDHSSDGSFEVARRLAEAHPDRIRAFQLPENSGAGGEPRNVGIGHTRGRYVMFLDSDDELERNACRNMFEAAERDGSDFVSGLCVRRYLDTREETLQEWYSWLYERTQVLESITDMPDLFVWDTLATNKCYRRDFLVKHDLRFPKGMFYEDLLFAAEAYLTARRITLIPAQVYFWDVRPRSTEKSVTNRRHEIANLADRLEIHRRIDRLLDERGLTEIKIAKDVKFLKHDLVLHLRDLPHRDETYRHEFAALARDYLASLPEEVYDGVRPIQGISAYLFQLDDWENLIPAVDTLINRTKLSVPLVERDGRIYWCAKHLDTELGRKILDVTDLGYHEMPLGRLRLRNELTRFAEVDGRLRLSGRVVNPLGMIKEDARLSAHLEFQARNQGRRIFRLPVGEVRHDGDHVAWQAVVALKDGLRPVGLIDAIWDVRMVLEVDDTQLTTRLTADAPLEADLLAVRPRLTRLVADHLEPEISTKGHLAFQLIAHRPAAKLTQRLIERGVRKGPGRIARAGYRRARKFRKNLGSVDTKIRIYHRFFSKLPTRKGTVIFESHLGKQYSDSPRAIYEELCRRGLADKAIWSYAGKSPVGFPPEAKLVRRWSYQYLRALAQAEFWVDNQSYPIKLAKRPATTYVQTWHGSALKKMGFDQPEYKMRSRPKQREEQQALDRFDHFLIRSEHDVRTLARAFRLKDGTLMRVGYPRNDALVRARHDEEQAGRRVRGPLAAELGIPEDRTVLLYAPTFRQSGRGRDRFELPFDVERFAEEFGDRYVLLVRAHYLNHLVLPPSVRGRVINVSGLHDVTPVMALADALITDYSSVMFDYALLDRPIVFFTYDYDEYVHQSRGAYFDLREHAPGPVVQTADDLFAVLRRLETADADHAAARRRFVAEFGEHDQGTAAKAIVDQVFERGNAR